jgi:organic radical activating enzyme
MWCPLPWTHVGIKNNGTLRMCSHSQSLGKGNTVLYNKDKELNVKDLYLETLNCDTLKQVRRDILSGVWPLQCKRCEVEFQSSGNSRNVWETEKHKNFFTYEQALQNTLPDGTIIDPQIQDFDLRVGNFCNLRCVMCFAGESTKWLDDHEDIFGTKIYHVDGKQYSVDQGSKPFDWLYDTNITKLVAASQFLKKIKFGGGEPLVIKDHYDLLQLLIDKNLAKNIELEYSINLTTFPKNLLDMWKNFRQIILCCSIDGVGEVNESIRYPTKWDRVLKTLEQIDSSDKNIHAFTSFTVNILNLEHYDSFVEWENNMNFKKINKFEEHPNKATHPVYNPKYLSISILEQHQFNLMTNSDYYKHLYQQIKLTEEESILHRIQFVKSFDKFAYKQRQNWKFIFPKAYQVQQQWKEKYNV